MSRDVDPDTFAPDDFDVTPLADTFAEMQTVAYYLAEEKPLEFATPFRQAIRRLQAVLGTSASQRVEGFRAQSLGTLNELNVTTRRRLIDAVQSFTDETRTERRVRIRNELRQAGHHARTNLRTATNLAFSTAQAIRAQELGDTVWGFRYITADDERVRGFDDPSKPTYNHWAMHGVTRQKADPVWLTWWTPNGWNCRCRIAILFDEEPETAVPNVEPDPGWSGNPLI